MSELLTPDEVEKMLTGVNFYPEWRRLCRDYLTLWEERNRLRTAAEHLFEASGMDTIVADLDEYLEMPS